MDHWNGKCLHRLTQNSCQFISRGQKNKQRQGDAPPSPAAAPDGAIVAGMSDQNEALLALECSGRTCSVAIQCRGESCLAASDGDGRHSQHILRLAQRLLAQAGMGPRQLDAVVFGKGPGSFTGIRVAAATAMGLATGAQLPVIPISALAAMAQAHARSHSKIAVARDARLGEVYYGLYQARDGVAAAVAQDTIVRPSDVPELDGEHWFGAGDGWNLEGMKRSGISGYDSDRVASALDLLALAPAADRLDPEQALPSYLRQDVASKRNPHVKQNTAT